MKSKSSLVLRALCEGAIFVALAVALSLLPVWKMPNGGSFDLAMLPIFIFCARWGFGLKVFTLVRCFMMIVSNQTGRL